MKHITKPRVKKNRFLIILLSAIFAVLLAVSIILATLLSGDSTDAGGSVKPEILEGEGLKYNYATAYPEVKDDVMKTISVKNKTGEYIFSRDEKGKIWRVEKDYGKLVAKAAACIP